VPFYSEEEGPFLIGKLRKVTKGFLTGETIYILSEGKGNQELFLLCRGKKVHPKRRGGVGGGAMKPRCRDSQWRKNSASLSKRKPEEGEEGPETCPPADKGILNGPLGKSTQGRKTVRAHGDDQHQGRRLFPHHLENRGRRVSHTYPRGKLGNRKTREEKKKHLIRGEKKKGSPCSRR